MCEPFLSFRASKHQPQSLKAGLLRASQTNLSMVFPSCTYLLIVENRSFPFFDVRDGGPCRTVDLASPPPRLYLTALHRATTNGRPQQCFPRLPFLFKNKIAAFRLTQRQDLSSPPHETPSVALFDAPTTSLRSPTIRDNATTSFLLRSFSLN